MHGTKRHFYSFFAVVLTLVLLLPCTAVFAQAASSRDGLVVEKMTFRDVLRLYNADREHFGTDAMQTDEYGVSNAAKHLAELFTYTVGLNYTGEGSNSDYYGKNISGMMGFDPYVDGNLQATFDVEIRPYNGGAIALAEGQTTAIRVYLTGYVNAANGVEPILRYVWQDNGTWFAVKDDNPFYQVSYEGQSARQLAGTEFSLMRSCACGGGTSDLEDWEDLGQKEESGGIVHLDGSTIVTGQGTANIFGVTKQSEALIRRGGFAPCLLAVSDFVQGDTTWQTGPLVYTRQCMRESDMHMVPDGEVLETGVSYRFRVVYDEALTLAADADWSSVALELTAESSGRTLPVSDFVWYGASEYLTEDKFNPHVIEFTFTPPADETGVCTITPLALIGSNSTLTAAPFHACLQTSEVILTDDEVSVIAEETQQAVAPTGNVIPVLSDFGGDTGMTRLMLAQCLWDLAGKPMGEMDNAFTDMPQDAAAAQAVLWASRTGLIVGYGDGTFGGENCVTREQAAVILSRYAALRGVTVVGTGDLNWYWDGWQVSSWAQNAVLWALQNGILTTWVEGYIYPAETATCSHVIGMLSALMKMY